MEVCADWDGLGGPKSMGRLAATPTGGGELFSFAYDAEWLNGPHSQQLDPGLMLFAGEQYPAADRRSFGAFLDSCPDRWGRTLMDRREALLARTEGRGVRTLRDSDYLLGVHDGHRMGALRFRTDGAFLDDGDELAAPPWTRLRELEHASLRLEQDGAEEHREYDRWLRMLVAPGSSLGGARPKASVIDPQGWLWIAKFPSRGDRYDTGGWEAVLHSLAGRAGVVTPRAEARTSGDRGHTFLSRRFDRDGAGARLHFASAMTLLERRDGDRAASGASYLELADLLEQHGARTTADLEQLWRRMVFFVCVSNVDDHLRNHGFLLEPNGWSLAPAYDMNPDPLGEGLTLNISDTDNAQDLDLVREVAELFRVKSPRAGDIIDEVRTAVATWRDVATERGLKREEQDRMRRAFRLADC